MYFKLITRVHYCMHKHTVTLLPSKSNSSRIQWATTGSSRSGAERSRRGYRKVGGACGPVADGSGSGLSKNSRAEPRGGAGVGEGARDRAREASAERRMSGGQGLRRSKCTTGRFRRARSRDHAPLQTTCTKTLKG